MTHATDFCLPDANNKEVCLKQFFGKWIILYFYPKDNTSGCTLEAVNFTEKLDEIEKLDAIVIGISPDSSESHRKFSDKNNLRHKLLSDTEKSVLSKYGVWQKKRMYGREYMGVVRTTILINPNGDIVKRWDKVKVKGHVGEVIDTLRKQKDY